MIWMEEINQYLVLKLRDNLSIPSENIFYASPELDPGEGIPGGLPRVTVNIYDLRVHFDKLRVDYNLKLIKNETDDTITLVDKPAPYWIYYQFSTLTNFQQKAIQLQTEISQLFSFRKYIEIATNAKTSFELENLAEPLEITIRDNETEISSYQDVYFETIEDDMEEDEYVSVSLDPDTLIFSSLEEGQNGNSLSVEINGGTKNLSGGDKQNLFLEQVEYKQPIPDRALKTRQERRNERRFKSVMRYRISAELPPQDAEQVYYIVKERDLEVEPK